MNKQKDGIYFDREDFKGIIRVSKNKLHVKGLIKEPSNSVKIKYWASDPVDYRYSFSGSGLPFANKQQAYSNKINVGEVIVKNSEFKFTITMPNSFYINLGSELIKPLLNISICGNNKVETIKLNNGIPYRFLNHPANIDYKSNLVKIYKPSGPNFYVNHLPIRSQEQILRDSAYPVNSDKMPDNFWGLKPAL
jgi:hypothetical protein